MANAEKVRCRGLTELGRGLMVWIFGACESCTLTPQAREFNETCHACYDEESVSLMIGLIANFILALISVKSVFQLSGL